MGKVERAVLNVGPFEVEICREDDCYTFRPIVQENPTSMIAIEANFEHGIQGGAWAPVPPDLLEEAKQAFARTSASKEEGK